MTQTASTTQWGGTNRFPEEHNRLQTQRHKDTQHYNKEAEQDSFDCPVSFKVSLQYLQRHTQTSCSGECLTSPNDRLQCSTDFCQSVSVLHANNSSIRRRAKIIRSHADLISSAGTQVFPTMHRFFIQHVAKRVTSRLKKITTT